MSRAGSLSAAARQLGVAQPTVGRRIALLQEKLGAEFFVRTPTGQTLSPTGRRALAHAEQMDLDSIAVERVASGRDRGLRGRVAITASNG